MTAGKFLMVLTFLFAVIDRGFAFPTSPAQFGDYPRDLALLTPISKRKIVRRHLAKNFKFKKAHAKKHRAKKHHAKRHLKAKSASKLLRLAKALRTIRNARKKHAFARKMVIRHLNQDQTDPLTGLTNSLTSVGDSLKTGTENVVSAVNLPQISVNTTTTTTETNTVEEDTNFFKKATNALYDITGGLGHVSGYIPEKMGFDYSEDTDFVSTGLGTIGLSYGLYDYFRRKDDFKGLSKILHDRYKVNGIHNAALEQENYNLATINRNLERAKVKVQHAKKAIQQKVEEGQIPLFTE